MNNSSPYETPKSFDPETSMKNISFDGNVAVVKNPAILPNICRKCGATECDARIKKTLTKVNPIIILWILLSPLILIIAYLITNKKLKIEYSLCENCYKKYKAFKILEAISWLSFFGMIFAAVLITEPTPYLMLPMLISFLTALFFTAIKENGLSVKKYQDGYFYVKGIEKINDRNQS